MYAIKTDLRRRVLHITMSGFFSPELSDAFIVDLRKAITDLSVDNGYFVLVDLLACALQSQAMVEIFQQFITARPHHAKRIALLAGRSVSRMQARRLLVDDRVRMFDSDEEAARWVAPSPDVGLDRWRAPASV